ncbi:HepT-like ribonuclease domain-containing protein [Sodalinema gerasimenkoae]|uniref:HepT-like ribonuclease domain-containing protein n=1 Tax=Sodalinema gerasimenkoae TaxID=2862348 RepID=UPI001358506B|nr:HepT-like ribonuclease domain-containing protein [Sodalinema gerasimenkoae]
MPSRSFLRRLQDVVAEIEVIESMTQGLTYQQFSDNPQVLRATLYSIAVIGEAISSGINDLEALDSSIPWFQIRGLRNRVIHEYFQVDSEVIWETLHSDLPILKKSLTDILESYPSV